MVEAKINKIKLKTNDEASRDTKAVLYTSCLFSNFELKLKKVVSIPYVKITFRKEMYAKSSELMPYSAGRKARVNMGVRK